MTGRGEGGGRKGKGGGRGETCGAVGHHGRVGVGITPSLLPYASLRKTPTTLPATCLPELVPSTRTPACSACPDTAGLRGAGPTAVTAAATATGMGPSATAAAADTATGAGPSATAAAATATPLLTIEPLSTKTRPAATCSAVHSETTGWTSYSHGSQVSSVSVSAWHGGGPTAGEVSLQRG